MMRLLRNPKHFTMYALALLVTLVLAACGGGPVPAELTEQDAEGFASFATQSLSMQLSLFESPLGMVPFVGAANLATAQSSDCVSVSSTADSDSDGIPNDATYTYNCNQSGVTASGTVRVQDAGSGNVGYTITMNDFSFAMSFNGQSFSFGYDGTASATVSGATYEASIDMVISFTAGDESGEFGLVFDQTYVADNTTDPFANGTLTFTGSISITNKGQLFSLDATTTSALEVDSTCGESGESGIRSGTVEYSDNNSTNTVSVSYTNCSPSVTYNGSPIGTN